MKCDVFTQGEPGMNGIPGLDGQKVSLGTVAHPGGLGGQPPFGKLKTTTKFLLEPSLKHFAIFTFHQIITLTRTKGKIIWGIQR